MLAAPARAAEGEAALPHVNWSFSGLFGTFDRAAAQRGFQVYDTVCSNCHSLKQAYYRDLAGIGLSEDADQGDRRQQDGARRSTTTASRPTVRPAVGPLPLALPQRQAARAAINGGAAARPVGDHQGPRGRRRLRLCHPDRLCRPARRLSHAGTGMYYNKYFPGHQIAMPPPLQRRHRHLHRRHQAHARPGGARRRHLPDLHRQPRDGAAARAWACGGAVPGLPHRRDLRGEAQGLVGCRH